MFFAITLFYITKYVTSLIYLYQGLFALASMPSHSCVANATHDFSSRETGYRMVMRAVVRDNF